MMTQMLGSWSFLIASALHYFTGSEIPMILGLAVPRNLSGDCATFSRLITSKIGSSGNMKPRFPGNPSSPS